jgi:hypothetical protein
VSNAGKVDARQGQRLMHRKDAQSTNCYYHEKRASPSGFEPELPT